MKIKLIDFGYTHAPKRAHENDAGADVFSTRSFQLQPHETYAVPLGFGLELPDGVKAHVGSRTSGAKKGLHCHECPIDSGYRGECHAIITNLSCETISIKTDERIGQLIVEPIIIADFINYNIEERGTGAFGSTGK